MRLVRPKNPPKKLDLQPRRTVFCFDHFCLLAALGLGEISSPATESNASTAPTSSKRVSKRTAAGKIKKPTPLPTRVQPRRAVRDKSKSASPPPKGNQPSEAPTPKLGPAELTLDSFTKTPQDLRTTRSAVLTHTKPFREEIGRRIGTSHMRCSFGPRQWHCDVCHAQEEQSRKKLGSMAIQAREQADKETWGPPCAPVADMGLSVEGSCEIGEVDCTGFGAWDGATVSDTETVSLGDMTFALDMCENTLKFMLLTASKAG